MDNDSQFLETGASDDRTLAEFLADYLSENELSVAEFVSQAGISSSTVYRILKTNACAPSILGVLAQTTGQDLNRLIRIARPYSCKGELGCYLAHHLISHNVTLSEFCNDTDLSIATVRSLLTGGSCKTRCLRKISKVTGEPLDALAQMLPEYEGVWCARSTYVRDFYAYVQTYGMTQAEFAEYAGVHRNTLTAFLYEDHKFRSKTMMKILIAIDSPPNRSDEKGE